VVNSKRVAYIDETGHVVLPPELLSLYQLQPGSQVRLLENENGIQLQLPSRLAKLYIEPTNQCNLNCRTCMRNDWDEPQGMMSDKVFSGVIDGLRSFSPMPAVFFGGLGEPLFHPNIVDMVARAKSLGIGVELITNGTLLTRKVSQGLVEAGLDTLWVSLDGATPESYTDIRLGAELPRVLENLADFRGAISRGGTEDCFPPLNRFGTQLGIAFVAMKRNIADLPEVIDIGQRFGASHFLVTNVLPYTRSMVDEVLYYRTLNNGDYKSLNLPGIDMDKYTRLPIYQTLHNACGSWSGTSSESMRNRCPFIEKGVGAINWEGNLSPCLPLLHSHVSYLGHLKYDQRFSRRWPIGNVMEHDLRDLWNTPEHLAFRERVLNFDFSPCMTCGSCELSEKNEEDCYGNKFPTCGSCLWAQGVIGCP
jgi:MoaA/NifB/PqqE/SkfB family radical SAM enzyme